MAKRTPEETAAQLDELARGMHVCSNSWDGSALDDGAAAIRSVAKLEDDCEAWAKNYQELQAKYADAVAIAGNLHAANLERIRLVEWRDSVTSALQRPGGAKFDEVAQHIRRLRENLNAMKTLASEFVRYYVEGTEGCRNCGGFPHADTCFVGRFNVALGWSSLDATSETDYCDDCHQYHLGGCERTRV